MWRVSRVRLAAGARLGHGNVLRNLRLVCLGPSARVGRRNTISSHPVYPRLYPDGAHLVVGPHGVVTDEHHLDCAGGLELDEFAMIGGRGTEVLTHSVDLERDVQVAHPVRIGERSFVGGGALLLGGAILPGCSVLAPGAVLLRSRTGPRSGLWQGVPACRVGEVDDPWFRRPTNAHPPAEPALGRAESPDRFPSAQIPRAVASVVPRPIDVARAVVWLFPASRHKNAMLRALGHAIDPGARATPNLVWRVRSLTMASGSRIAELNRIVGVGEVRLGSRATIGRWNRVYASSNAVMGGAVLTLADGAKITGRHVVDTAAGIRLDAFSVVAGRESVLISGNDGRGGRPAPIRIGARSFIGTRCLLGPGATVPSRSLLAAGSRLGALPEDEVVPGLWAGAPARYRRPVAGRWFDRETSATHRVFVPGAGVTVEDAF